MCSGHDHHNQAATDSIDALAETWWAERRELRAGSAWSVPFPPRAAESARVLHDAGSGPGGEAMWYAALLRPRAATAYIEVHSAHGPVAALVSLYEHVC
ncbi:MAG TPA: hypothetical protein VKV26_05230 [Dehalococcoidia bacterium]|nr:hypothetical protein [Dehalococcoidia bacterium]